MALRWSEIQASEKFRTADEAGQNQQRIDFLSKVKPEMSDEAFKILENRVMLKEQPSNQYGTSSPTPTTTPGTITTPFDYDTGVKMPPAGGKDPFPDIPWADQAPQYSNAPGIPEAQGGRMDTMKWSEFIQKEAYRSATPKGRQELAESFLAVQERFMTKEGFNILRDRVRQSVAAGDVIPASTKRQIKEGQTIPPPAISAAPDDRSALSKILGIQKYTEAPESLRKPWADTGEPLMATREEMIAAGITKPSETEEAIGLKEPRLKTLSEVQGLQAPGENEGIVGGFVTGAFLNPPEMLAMGVTGATIAARFGKPLLATSLDYALAGVPSIGRGLKGFAKGIAGGIKGIETIAASRNVPPSNTLDMIEAPLLDDWANAMATDAAKTGKWAGKTYAESLAEHAENTKSALIKYFKDNNFTPDEINIFLKTGDVPPTVPLYETRLIPGPGKGPTQMELPIKPQGFTTETTSMLPGPEGPAKQLNLPIPGDKPEQLNLPFRKFPLVQTTADEAITTTTRSWHPERAQQMGLPLEKPPLVQPPPEEPIVIPGRIMKVPSTKTPSGITPDDLDHPYLGNLNPRIKRSGTMIKGLWQAGMQAIENPIRMFLKAGGNLKREIYDRIEDSDMAVLREFHDRFLPVIQEWKKKANPKRLAIYMVNRQEDGAAILKNMGINVAKELAKLTPDEMAIANQMDDFYRELFHRINVARIKAGLPEIGKRKDYFTFYRQMDWVEKNMGLNPLDTLDMDEMLAKKFIHPNSTFFGEALSRSNNDFIPVELDAFQSFGRYSQNALNHIHISPEIARGRKVIQQIAKSHPELHSDITNWLDFVAGKQENVLHPLLRRALLSSNKRVALSVLSWNFRTMLVQPTALKNTYAKAGLVDTLGGIYDVLMSSRPLRMFNAAGKAKEKLIRDNSNLLGRKFDIAVDDILKLAKGPIQKIGRAGMRPMQELDMLTAEASWHAFYRQGNKMGLKGKDLVRYANDNVILTQASGRKQHLAKIQRSDLGRLVSTLQTFVINDWGFMTEEVLGLGKNVPMNKANVGRVYRWLAGTILVNTFFEDVLNIYSPYPAPIKRTIEEINKKDPTFWSVAKGLGRELMDVTPIIGSAVRYRSGFGGPTFETIRKAFSGQQFTEQAAKITGIPISFIKTPQRLAEGKGIKTALVGEKEKETKSTKKTLTPISSAPSQKMISKKSKSKGKKKIQVLTPLN